MQLLSIIMIFESRDSINIERSNIYDKNTSLWFLSFFLFFFTKFKKWASFLKQRNMVCVFYFFVELSFSLFWDSATIGYMASHTHTNDKPHYWTRRGYSVYIYYHFMPNKTKHDLKWKEKNENNYTCLL